MKVLLTKRRALGDTVLLSSTVTALQEALPAAEISVLVPKAFAPVLERHPAIRELLNFDDHPLALLRRVRAARYDHLIQLHASPGLRWLGWLSGARQAHFHVQNAEAAHGYGRLPHALEWDTLFLRELFGAGVPAAPLPKIYLSEGEAAAGREFWRARGADPARVLFLGLGASRPTKRWWPAHFARLAELARDRLELIPAIVTGPGEEEARFAGLVVDELRVRGFRPLTGAGGRGDFVHAGGLSVRGLAGALGAVRAYVGNDSGPKHMAVAVGRPTLTLFGPEDPGEWHPYPRGDHPLLFREGLACRSEDNGRWCGLQTCEAEAHRCMGGLDPLNAFEALRERLFRG